MNIQAALLDDEIFRGGYDILNASTLDLTEFSTTHIEGRIQCDRSGLLYTSIPDDGNWKVKVDGMTVPIVHIANAMIGIDLTEGYHEIEFEYENKAFTFGTLITVSGILILMVLIYLNDREKWNSCVLRIYHKIKK